MRLMPSLTWHSLASLVASSSSVVSSGTASSDSHGSPLPIEKCRWDREVGDEAPREVTLEVELVRAGEMTGLAETAEKGVCSGRRSLRF